MRLKLFLVLGMFMFISCAEELIKKPENLIAEDKMISILKQMAIVNAAKGTNLGKLRDNGIEPTNFVFEKYEIDSAQFVNSNRYYASKPLLYEAMYKKVESDLEDQRLQLEAEKKVRDSLNLLKKAEKKDVLANDTLAIKRVQK